MSSIFQIQASMTKISTMANWLRIQFDTLETLSPEHYKRLFELNNKQGWLSYNVHRIEAEDIIDLPPIKQKDAEKYTPSQRLRHVLYRLWNQEGSSKSFDDYYEYYINYLIDRVKDKLE